jgi:hypothetical protein
VAANGSTVIRSPITSETSLLGPPNSKDLKKEPNCLRISTQPRPVNPEDSNPTFNRYLPSNEANSYIRDALKNNNATKDVQVAGIWATKTGYIIRFKDTCSAENAKNNTEWLRKLGNGTKLVKPLFGIVVHRVPTTSFLLPSNETEGIQKIMTDNDLEAKGFQIDRIAWLKRPDKPLGMHASMGIWLNSAEAAEWVINNGFLVEQQYIGSVEHYQLKGKQCHQCQRFGHLAWSCKEQARCGFCGSNHERRNCPPGARARCLDYYRPHPTGDKGCQMEHSLATQQQ